MACEYVRDYYNVPADIGVGVIVHGDPGVIIEDRGNYIGVNFDKDKPGVVMNCHPTDDVQYGKKRSIRKMTRSQARYQQYLRDGDCYDDFRHYLMCCHNNSTP